MRWTLLFGKKRGERRTGSRELGRAGWALFAAVFFTAGIISLAFFLLKLSIPEWRVNHHFVEVQGKVLDLRMGTDAAGLTRPEIEVAYDVDGKRVVAWSHYDITGVYQSDLPYTSSVLAQFEKGQEYPCWYDPRNPESVVLVQGYTWLAWLMLILPTAFISIGGGGLIYTVLTWGKSTERLAATAQNPPGLEFFLPPQRDTGNTYPYVPDPKILNDSAGTVLAYRLPPGTGGWHLWAMIALCVLWNAATILFLRMVVQSFTRGAPEWALTVCLVPVAVVGLFFIAVTGRALFVELGVGPTLVEISAHPLRPGEEYQIFMSQTGRLPVKTMALKLVCEETATYRQGTNTRKATRRVYEQDLLAGSEIELPSRLPFEVRTALQVPAQAMHSFKAVHNRIDWKIVVKASGPRWPNFERSFPIVVRPVETAVSRL